MMRSLMRLLRSDIMQVIKQAATWPIVLQYTQQRRLFCPRKQGYCTSSSYDGKTGQDVEVDGVNVTYEEINLLEFFSEKEFVHCANGEYVVDEL